MTSPKILFAGGGTGGHLFPGIAVADEIKKRFSSAEITFLGSKRAIEKQIMATSGYSHHAMESKSSKDLYRHPVRFISNNWKSYRECYTWIHQNRPDVVVGLGGFTSVPVIMAAYRMKVPVVLLEQNTVPGRANRMLNSVSSAVCTSFDVSETYFSKKARIEQTGNPIRGKILNLNNDVKFSRKHEARTLLILGGSQGAEAVNQMVMDAIPLLGKELMGWKIIHQTGNSDYEQVRKFYSNKQLEVRVHPFFDDMNYCYSNADLVISRAGATSLAEFSVLGLPTIIVPYPNSIGNHQLHNAWYYSDLGAAKIVEQEENPDLSATALISQLKPLLKMETLRGKLRKNMLKTARRNATEDVVKIIFEVGGIQSQEYVHPHHVHFLKKRSRQDVPQASTSESNDS